MKWVMEERLVTNCGSCTKTIPAGELHGMWAERLRRCQVCMKRIYGMDAPEQPTASEPTEAKPMMPLEDIAKKVDTELRLVKDGKAAAIAED